MRALYSIQVLVALSMLSSAPALAKSTKDLTYGYDTIWTTTVRFLRADRGYKITDRDSDSGYILFIYPGTGSVKECSAALELVPTVNEDGHDVIRLQLGIAHQPSYIEISLLDRLERKLLDERGEPPPPRKRRKHPPKKPPKEPQKKLPK